MTIAFNLEGANNVPSRSYGYKDGGKFPINVGPSGSLNVGTYLNLNQVQTSLNKKKKKKVQTSEASFQTETLGAPPKLTQAQREKKKQIDNRYKEKIKEKTTILEDFVPGCSKVIGKVQRLDEIINHVQRQFKLNSATQMEAAKQIAENKHLTKENERLNAEKTGLKEENERLNAEKTRLADENERLYAEKTKLTEENERLNGKQLQHQSVSLLQATDHFGTNSEVVDKLQSSKMNELQNMQEELVPVYAPILMSEGVIVLPNNVESQVNATEAPRDACLQVQEIPHNNEREREGVLSSNEEAEQVTCGSANESDEAEFSSGGAGDEPSALDGITGEPSAKVLSSNKRKRSVEDVDVGQAKGAQPLNEAAKDSAKNQEMGDRNLTVTTNKSTGFQARGESQDSDPPAEECIHIGPRRRKETMSRSPAERFLTMELCASRPISNGDVDAAVTDILLKLEADDESTVEFSDFACLDGERIKVGKFSVPLSLHPIVKNINDVYGDVSATVKVNRRAAEPIYIMFCAVIKEMSNLRLEQVTEGRIFKWRDAIMDALRINFNVYFAMDRLKKIACAYIRLMEHLKVENAALRIFNMDEEEFNDKHVSSGEKLMIDCESGGDDFDGGCCPPAGKKSHFTASQVHFLERSFKVENKLEPERKFRLAKEVGLQPREVALWFQDRLSQSKNIR